MDDPWAGPSWSTPSKATSSMTMPKVIDRTANPPPRFEESDPWGAPASTPASASASALTSTSPSVSAAGSNLPGDVDQTQQTNLTTPGWGDDTAAASASWSETHVQKAIQREQGGLQEQTEASPETPIDTQQEDTPHGDVWQAPDTAGPAEGETSPDASSNNQAATAALQTPVPKASSPTPSPPAVSPTNSPTRHTQPALDFQSEGFGPSSPSAAVPPIPKSPSFGDDFGGFSTGPAFNNTTTTESNDDPWGSGAASGVGASSSVQRDEGWGGENLSWGGEKADAMPSWGATDNEAGFGGEEEGDNELHPSFGQMIPSSPSGEENDTTDEDEGWGRTRPAVGTSAALASKPRGEDDWEEAQRRIQIQNERAPREKIDALAKVWTELLGSVITQEVEKRTGAEEITYEETVQRLHDDVADKARSLSTIPPDINTYPPVVSSLITHERFVYALQRPNPAPTTSLLHTASALRRPKRVDPLALNSSSSEPSWTSRSMLGEPDAPPQAADNAVQQEDAGKSRWSFWGKRPVPERQLTTSGGGILEVKAMSPTPSIDRQSSDIRASSSSRPASRAPSISTHPSRPSSPAPSFSPSITGDQQQTTMQAAPSSSLPQAPPVQPAPSAVSRFFGRLSRKQSSSSPVPDVDAKEDLELSADDFSYLSEVPSMSQPPPPEKGVGDLLALEPGRTEQIAGLESLLNSKAAPLPRPLAPPPKGPAGVPLSNARSSSGRFVARMKAPAPTVMDLLGGLDLSGPSSASTVSAQSPIQQYQSPSPGLGSSSSSAWDDFLSLEKSVTPPARSTPQMPAAQVQAPVTPMSAARLVASRSGTPAVSLSPPPPPAPATMPTMSSVLPVPATPVGKSRAPALGDFGDFDDFGTPQHASTSTFDDFGDFSAFDSAAPSTAVPHTAAVPAPPGPGPFNLDSFTSPNSTKSNAQTPSKPPPVPTPSSKPTLSTPSNHARPGSLDHTPTINLMSGASASKGKRWPAPASPIAPVLAPPPKGGSGNTFGSSSAGFPFLSPPPPVRPVSRGGGTNLLDDAVSDSSPASSAPISRSSSGTPSAGAGIGMGISTFNAPPVQSPPMFGGALGATSQPPARSLSSTPVLSPPQAPTQHTPFAALQPQVQGGATGGKGGLSAQDLSFFDSL
ncbi:hypothetical protein IAU59_007508 [Kwoniella sp. CBS 9459]